MCGHEYFFSDWVNLIFEFRLLVPIKLLAKSMVTFSIDQFQVTSHFKTDVLWELMILLHRISSQEV